jgi:hypothetical protein
MPVSAGADPVRVLGGPLDGGSQARAPAAQRLLLAFEHGVGGRLCGGGRLVAWPRRGSPDITRSYATNEAKLSAVA